MTTGAKAQGPAPGAGVGMRVAIVASRFNETVTERLLAGARKGLLGLGVDEGSIFEAWVPGAFELPLAAHRLGASGDVDAVVCLGAVIRGETDHYDFVCAEAAAGISRVQLDTGVPCAFGVITCDTMEQALARAGGGKRHQGEDAAHAVLGMAELRRQLAY